MKVPDPLDLIDRLNQLRKVAACKGSDLSEKEIADMSMDLGSIAEILMWYKSQGFTHPAIDSLLTEHPQLHEVLQEYKKPTPKFKSFG